MIECVSYPNQTRNYCIFDNERISQRKDLDLLKKEYFNKRNIYQIDEHTLKIVNEYDTIIDAVKTTGLTKAIITKQV